jgi:hypothetical protein
VLLSKSESFSLTISLALIILLILLANMCLNFFPRYQHYLCSFLYCQQRNSAVPVWCLCHIRISLFFIVVLPFNGTLSTCFFIILSGVRLCLIGTAATIGLLYQPRMVDDGDCRAIGGMKIGRGNRSIWRRPAQMPLCPPQIPHDETGARTR